MTWVIDTAVGGSVCKHVPEKPPSVTMAYNLITHDVLVHSQAGSLIGAIVC